MIGFYSTYELISLLPFLFYAVNSNVILFQNKNISAGHSVGDFSSVASFSTKTYISPETSYMHSPALSTNVPKHKSLGDIPT